MGMHTTMIHKLRIIVTPALLAVFFLSGCSPLNGLTGLEGESGEIFRPPIVSDRFLLHPGQQVVGELQVIEARYEDTFVDIARSYNLGFDELVEANPNVDPWLPGAGTEILLPTQFILPDAPQVGIVINVAAKRLFFYPQPDEKGLRAVVTYPIGIGKTGTATPMGETTVTGKGRDPVWFVPASIRREYAAAGNPLPAQVPPGPDNPLGRHVLLLGMPSYLIHGTNKPAGVGMRVSHGCVRLFPENIEHLYGLAGVGTEVKIVNQPLTFGWRDEQLYMDVHSMLEDDDRDRAELLTDLLAANLAGAPDTAPLPDELHIQELLDQQTGIPGAVLQGGAAGLEQLAAVMRVNNLVTVSFAGVESMASSILD